MELYYQISVGTLCMTTGLAAVTLCMMTGLSAVTLCMTTGLPALTLCMTTGLSAVTLCMPTGLSAVTFCMTTGLSAVILCLTTGLSAVTLCMTTGLSVVTVHCGDTVLCNIYSLYIVNSVNIDARFCHCSNWKGMIPFRLYCCLVRIHYLSRLKICFFLSTVSNIMIIL